MITIVITAIVTIFVIIVVLNFTPGEKQINQQIDHTYGIDDPLFQHGVGYLLGPPLLEGNQVTPLINGGEIFPAMLQAISEAQFSVCFETYLYAKGKLGRTFARALSERARAGVPVHVIIDYLGSLKVDPLVLNEMTEAGVEVVKYHPLRWYTLTQLNNRTHRKLLIVDGKIGFIGGVGISDEWLGGNDVEEPWRDTHARITGPTVAHLQSAFMDNWLKTRSQVLHGESYFPLLQHAGDVTAQVFRSSSDEGGESARLMFLYSIACAKHSISISASYFIPDELAIKTLCDARARGVQIEVIVPGRITDQRLVRLLSRNLWGKLLKCGIRIYEYQPAMYHAKVIIVDGKWTSVGSMNFDNRSFRLNDEANLNCFNPEFAMKLRESFEVDKTKAKEISFADWKSRSTAEKIVGTGLRVIRTQL